LGRQEIPPGKSRFICEAIRPSAGNQDVRQFLHDRARHVDGILMLPHRRDGARCQIATVHDARVKLDFTEQIGQAAVSD
jgi:hypothetical protein